ncbi:MAG: ribosome maturation factor RimM [Candidatus Sedimenticola sp. (ex Thyasira tokunagai)]
MDDSSVVKREDDWVVLGRVSGFYGVRGWVKIFSHTSPRSGILQYRRWYLHREGTWQPCDLESGREQGKGIVAKLSGFNDRDEVAELIGIDIGIPRNQLPEVEQDEYYWVDLKGLEVRTVDGVELGRVDHLFETGANDVMVVEGDRRRLIPFIGSVVGEIDLQAGLMTVDWDPDF